MTEMITIGNRTTGVCEYGDGTGKPIFYFHGFPGSRRDGELLNFSKHGSDRNFRIIALDRPGIGLTEYSATRSLLDIGDDIARLADKLQIKDFSVAGFSGGGPYALACAFKLAERIRSVGLIGSMGPLDHKEARRDNAMFVPRQVAIVRKIIASQIRKRLRKDCDRMVRNMIRALPKPDREYFFTGNNLQKMSALFHDNFKDGTGAFLKEADIYRQPWGFELSQLKVPVQLWHGTVDRNVTLSTARRLASELRDCRTHFIKDEGHFSLPGKHFAEILTSL